MSISQIIMDLAERGYTVVFKKEEHIDGQIVLSVRKTADGRKVEHRSLLSGRVVASELAADTVMHYLLDKARHDLLHQSNS